MSPTKTLPFLVGPTASGKTALALAYAQSVALAIEVEIISIDSALVYRHMDIGTAKPSAAELAQVPHHLINVIDPTDTLSVAETCKQVLVAIDDIRSRGAMPLCVGGTMMTVFALLNGLSDLPEANEEVRAALDADAKRIGWPAMHERLTLIDPVSASKIKPNDKQRLQRALEVHALTGQALSEVQGKRQSFLNESHGRPVIAVLMPTDRAWLHRRIETRLTHMFSNGLVDEVRALQEQYALTPEHTAMRTVGYRQTWQFLNGEITWPQCQAQSLFATRQLAKRQITWLRSLLIERPDCLQLDPQHLSIEAMCATLSHHYQGVRIEPL